MDLHVSAFELEMYLEGKRVITPAEVAEADTKYEADLKYYEEVALPEYTESLDKYKADLRAYYKTKHDGV